MWEDFVTGWQKGLPWNWDWSGKDKMDDLQDKVNKDAEKAGVKPGETAPQYTMRTGNGNTLLIAGMVVFIFLALKD